MSVHTFLCLDGHTCGNPVRLVRDHSHRTGADRGLLCDGCNRLLGPRYTADWLRRAAAYLDRHPDPEAP